MHSPATYMLSPPLSKSVPPPVWFCTRSAGSYYTTVINVSIMLIMETGLINLEIYVMKADQLKENIDFFTPLFPVKTGIRQTR